MNENFKIGFEKRANIFSNMAGKVVSGTKSAVKNIKAGIQHFSPKKQNPLLKAVVRDRGGRKSWEEFRANREKIRANYGKVSK